jgi:hypothetical protein
MNNVEMVLAWTQSLNNINFFVYICTVHLDTSKVHYSPTNVHSCIRWWIINFDNIELVLKLLRLFEVGFAAEVSEEVAACILGP